jgi:D-glycero-D-manno-heptose 1,7-bisphosphate phosphatase
MSGLVLLDRDGVINEDRSDFIRSPRDFKLIDGSAEAIAKLNNANFKIAIVTNQSGIGRGLFDEAILNAIHERLRGDIARYGAAIDAIFYCSDAPWAAGPRRKPEPGMLREAMTMFRSAPTETMMIGDSLRDLQAAHAAGCRRILVRTGNGPKTQAEGIPANLLPVSVYTNLSDAASAILGEDAAGRKRENDRE